MEGGSDGESNRINSNSPSDATKKPKRQMKTPYQLETLENSYASEAYPSEATRAELSEKLGLSDRQLQMWFCHRRLKDKKESTAKNSRAAGSVGRRGLLDSTREEFMVAEPGSGHGSRSGSGSGSGSSQFDYGDHVPMLPRYHDSPRSVMERRVIACVEAQLGEPLREDGPILGMEFDVTPPGAFGAPIVMTDHHQDRLRHSYDSNIFERSDAKLTKATGLHHPVEHGIKSDAHRKAVSSNFYGTSADGPISRSASLTQAESKEYGVQVQVLGSNLLSEQSKPEHFSSPHKETDSIPYTDSSLRIERKRKVDEAKIGRDVQNYEKRIRKELEKQDILRRKREEQMRKEMEKHERERRKEEGKIMREKQRQEERFQREERREMERREKILQKELLKAEKMRQKEELRREREAARHKAAMERATARKIARESMELIEDERLELMELAASSKGLASILSLDHETLQSLDTFRDSLCDFPPKSVPLKRPFAIQPWIDSDENIGNLLMVWRFCMTFADILGLWPFTLDEFVQAFHDYDSRLLGEIHNALLRLIIKDIEDVARTPSGGPGTNQYTSANPEGGHPQIVEGAFLWGFDICIWKKHLNPLTWPEILRQLALSAGFGPQLKKKNMEQQYSCENDESKGCEDIVTTLRNGSAAENAVAVMQEKGFSLHRKSRHRLTPGTVKFAAYHVLSLEGGKGLNVLDLAEKIQTSGLRDLTTSKTPEASISVALSRDPILFERIAPSTYCVRPAFRKDPADAESILSSARDKIQKYANGFLAGENTNDVERDDDSECDVAEGPEADDLGTPLDENKNNDLYTAVGVYSGNKKDNLCSDMTSDLQDELDNTSILLDHFIEDAGKELHATKPVPGGTEIDESTAGEPWIQGLTEGEYSDLCVEERLRALVALIAIANEGNTIRAVLEDRLDAANALKKQLWAETQLDKRRVKEENITKFCDSSFTTAAEGHQSPLLVADNKNDTAFISTEPKEDPSKGGDDMQDQLDSLPVDASLVANDTPVGQITSLFQQNGCTTERSRMQLKSFIGHRAEEMYVYRSLPLGQDRRRNRYWQFVASASRHDPGSGRIFVESYDGQWRLIDSDEAFDTLVMSLDTRGIRESHLYIMLQKIETCFKERNLQFDDIMADRGNATKYEVVEMGVSPVCTAIIDSPGSAVCGENFETREPSLSFKLELGGSEPEKKNALKRYQDLQAWMWKECFNSSTLCAMTYGKRECSQLLAICDFCLDTYNCEQDLCPSCHRKLDNKLSFTEHELKCAEMMKIDPENLIIPEHPLRNRLIKALLAFLEISVPSEAFQSSWTEDSRKNWALKLHKSSCTVDLLQMLTLFEVVINRDYLSADFETTEELLDSCASSGTAVYNSLYPRSVPQLPWIPQTTAAVALRLLELDASISYSLQKKSEPHGERDAGMEDIAELSSRWACMKSIQSIKTMKMNFNDNKKKTSWANRYGIQKSSGIRKAVRGRGSSQPRGRGQLKASRRILPSGKRSLKGKETLNQVLTQQRQKELGHNNARGPRTLRKRRIEKRVVKETQLDHWADNADNSNSAEESPINLDEKQLMHDENEESEEDDVCNGMESDESGDDALAVNYLAGYDASCTRRTRDAMVMSDEDIDDNEEDDGSGEELDENLEGDEDANSGSDRCENRNDEEDDENLEDDDDISDGSDRGGDENEDEGSDSAVSGDFSE